MAELTITVQQVIDTISQDPRDDGILSVDSPSDSSIRFQSLYAKYGYEDTVRCFAAVASARQKAKVISSCLWRIQHALPKEVIPLTEQFFKKIGEYADGKIGEREFDFETFVQKEIFRSVEKISFTGLASIQAFNAVIDAESLNVSCCITAAGVSARGIVEAEILAGTMQAGSYDHALAEWHDFQAEELFRAAEEVA